MIFNGASSTMNIDNVATTKNPGTNGITSKINFGNVAGGGTTGVDVFEFGIWPVGFSSGQQTSMCHNQFTYWGTTTSC